MNAKDKAKQLVNINIEMMEKFNSSGFDSKFLSKTLASLWVDEIYKLDNLQVGDYEFKDNISMYYSYWEEVKLEIKEL